MLEILHLEKHGAPEGLQRPVGSRRDGLWRVSRVIPLPCDRVVRRVRSSAPATGSESERCPTVRARRHPRHGIVVHHDDGHHDDSRRDLPDGEPGLGQWRTSDRRVHDARAVPRDTRGRTHRGTGVWPAEIHDGQPGARRPRRRHRTVHPAAHREQDGTRGVRVGQGGARGDDRGGQRRRG